MNINSKYRNLIRVSIKTFIARKNILVKKSNFNFSSIQNTDNIQDFDVVIVGGGAVGMSMAAALTHAQSNLDIALIEPSHIKSPHKYEYSPNRIPDMRCVAMTPASINFLKSIGVYDTMDHRLIKEINEMQIWESEGSSFVNIKQSEVVSLKQLYNSINRYIPLKYAFGNYISTTENSDRNIAYMLEVGHVIDALENKIRNKISVFNETLSMETIDIDNTIDEYCYLTVRDADKSHAKSKTFRTKLLIASDGGKSVIRNKLNYTVTGYDYNETGLVCNMRLDRSSSVLFQRFLHNGIFALQPLYDNLTSMTCAMPKHVNEKILKLNDTEFKNFVNNILHSPSKLDLSQLERLLNDNANSFHNVPVVTEILTKRMTFPLTLQYVNDPVQNNVILLGDAAHSIHPMAGQGLNLGIADSALLSNILAENLSLGKRINDHSSLSYYSTLANINVKSMIMILESLKMTYEPTNFIVSAIRNLGMTMVNNSNIVKGAMVDYASGNFILPDRYYWEKNKI